MANQPPAWEVTTQVETTDLGPAGTFVPGVRVTFRTAAGVMGSVFVPRAEYRPDRVRELVSAAAATADAVQSLRG